jgi:hypothetical protein
VSPDDGLFLATSTLRRLEQNVEHLAISAALDVRTEDRRRAVNIPFRSIQKGPIVSKGELIGLRENSAIEFANGKIVSTSIKMNKSAVDGCREKTIEKTILCTFRARTFSRSLSHSRPGRASSKSGHARYAAESGSEPSPRRCTTFPKWHR